MKGHKKYKLIIGIIAILFTLSLIGCETLTSPEEKLRAEYQKGYEDGRQEEAEKYKGLDIELAEQLIGDIQRSQGHTLDIVNGRVKRMDIIRVDNNGQTAIVETKAYFHDDNYIGGILEFIFKDGYWYPMKTFKLEGPEKETSDDETQKNK